MERRANTGGVVAALPPHPQEPSEHRQRRSAAPAPAAIAHGALTGCAARLARYERRQKIGEGSYGRVYRCIDHVTGETVAMKQMEWADQSDGVPSYAVREISLLQELRHPNTVRLVEAIADSSKLFLIFEFCEKDLKKMLDQRATPIVGPKLKDIMYQLLSAVHACHSRRIVHRDIKLANILVSKDESTVKLADFGLGKAFSLPLQTCTQTVMTLLYRAPEILLGDRHYLPAVDMWSLGCVMAELARHATLFSAEGCWEMLISMFKLLGTPDERVWPGVSLLPHFNNQLPKIAPEPLASAVPALDEDGVDLLRRMLTYYPERRITAGQALQHRWFDEVRANCEARLQLMLNRQLQEQQEAQR